MDEYLANFKKKKHITKSTSSSSKIKTYISRFLMAIIFFLVSIIYTNMNDKNLLLYKEYVLTESFEFTKVKSLYEKLFGSVLPSESNQMVFEGSLLYKDITDYYEGEKLTVNNNTLINNITSGVVVYIGEKENYGNTIIIQGIDGVDIWYGNVTNIPVNLYDYVEKGIVIGEVNNDSLYLVIKKDNEYIKYEEYKNT